MMESGHMSGGAAIYRRFPIRASMANPGVIGISTTADNAGIENPTTTSFVNSPGLVLEAATYSTTQADLDDPASDANIGAVNTVSGLDMGRVVTVSIRPDLIIRALCSGGATEGTALALLTNTLASATGVTVTDAVNVPAGDFIGGVMWCLSGNNVGHCRPITTEVGSTSFTAVVPFPRAIAVGDTFCFLPYNMYGTGAGSADGVGNVQSSTLFTQADGSVASGTGGVVVVTSLDLYGRSDSYVRFKNMDHQYQVATN